MRVAIIASNNFKIDKDTKKGTEIIVHTFINSLAKYQKTKDFQITAFASGDSELLVKIESIADSPTSSNEYVTKAGKHVIFELALLSKAFSQQDQFDLYHIHIGDGDIALPFSPFVKRPILITLYHPADIRYAKKYFSLFKKNKNIFFVSPTNWQRKRLPSLPYVATIPHGIDTYNDFTFHPQGGTSMMWAGRAVPEKGINAAIEIAARVKQKIKLFGIPKKEHEKWFKERILAKIKQTEQASLTLNKNRLDLIEDFQKSRLFLFPIQWEEPFGLVLIEAMSCGTPVVAFAKGSVPEIIKDGETGFIVNPSDDDIRGDWIVKKTGIEGLIEAVKRIYSMPEKEYFVMRKACRDRVEKHFTVERMVSEYEKVYKKVTGIL